MTLMMEPLAATPTDPPPARIGSCPNSADDRVAERQTLALLRQMAKRRIVLFTPFHEWQPEDLVQEALLAVLKAAPSFDRGTARWSTFAYNVGGRRVLDLWKVRSRQHAREQAMAKPAECHDPEAEDLADWCLAQRLLARERYGVKLVKVGRHFYRVDRVAAIVLLQDRLRLSADALRDVLSRRPDLLAALGFRHTPGRRLFQDAAALLKLAHNADPDKPSRTVRQPFDPKAPPPRARRSRGR